MFPVVGVYRGNSFAKMRGPARVVIQPRRSLDSRPYEPATTDAELLQAGYRYAYALTHHREEAEDLVQETWLNLCRRYGRVENQALLFTSVRNLFIDQCRRKKIVQFDSLDGPDGVEIPEVHVEEEPCLKGELSKLLGHLKPGERELIFLHYYQGHTADEISQINGQSRGTILSNLHRSIAKLRKLCETDDGVPSRNQLLVLFVMLVIAARLVRL